MHLHSRDFRVPLTELSALPRRFEEILLSLFFFGSCDNFCGLEMVCLVSCTGRKSSSLLKNLAALSMREEAKLYIAANVTAASPNLSAQSEITRRWKSLDSCNDYSCKVLSQNKQLQRWEETARERLTLKFLIFCLHNQKCYIKISNI